MRKRLKESRQTVVKQQAPLTNRHVFPNKRHTQNGVDASLVMPPAQLVIMFSLAVPRSGRRPWRILIAHVSKEGHTGRYGPYWAGRFNLSYLPVRRTLAPARQRPDQGFFDNSQSQPRNLVDFPHRHGSGRQRSGGNQSPNRKAAIAVREGEGCAMEWRARRQTTAKSPGGVGAIAHHHLSSLILLSQPERD